MALKKVQGKHGQCKSSSYRASMNWLEFLLSLFLAAGVTPLAFFQANCLCCCAICSDTVTTVTVTVTGWSDGGCSVCDENYNGTFVITMGESCCNGHSTGGGGVACGGEIGVQVLPSPCFGSPYFDNEPGVTITASGIAVTQRIGVTSGNPRTVSWASGRTGTPCIGTYTASFISKSGNDLDCLYDDSDIEVVVS